MASQAYDEWYSIETQSTIEKQENDRSEKLALERHRNFPRHSKVGTQLCPQDKSICRLGKRELGPYAYESRMPNKLYNQLVNGGKRIVVQRISPRTGRLYRDITFENEISGMIPLLGFMLNNDPEVRHAYLCHDAVQHVFKMKYEGGFCGYRNAQMMLSFIQGSGWSGVENLKTGAKSESPVPNVIVLQEMIEDAWDKGYNSYARIETGGIRATRKYIGTSEVQALFESMKIGTQVSTFSEYKDPDSKVREIGTASDQLLDAIEGYFVASYRTASSSLHRSQDALVEAEKVRFTSLPPVYLQQPGHSMTIVGVELLRDGKRGLIVLDPAYRSSPAIMKLLRQRSASYKAASPSSSPAIDNSQQSPSLQNPRVVGGKIGSINAKSVSTFAAKALGVAPPSSYSHSSLQQRQPAMGKKRPRSMNSGSGSALSFEPPADRANHEIGSSGAAVATHPSSFSSRNSSAGIMGHAGSTQSPSTVTETLGSNMTGGMNPETATRLLYAYRRRRRRLARFSEFEILMLKPLL